MPIDTNQLLGQNLGNCVLERLIGYGGMGAVYLAQQSRPRRTVAVKVLMPELLPKTEGAYTEFLARFRREADAIAALDHVNIIPIYEYGEQEQIAYLVMPYVTGGTLRQLLAKRGKLPISEAVSIIEQAASALDYAHSHGIVHRDLKPGNILFHADGRLLLTDFGIAKVVNESPIADQTSLHTLTTTGTIIGTPEYLSPEQATANPVDGRSDIYSLGVVLFQMLSGHVPFTGATPVAIAVKHAMEEPPSLTQLNSAIPTSVEEVVRKALAKKPEDRYATASDLARAFAQAAYGDHGTQAPDFFSDKTVKDEDMVPVVLMSEQKVGPVPVAAEPEAIPAEVSQTPHVQEKVDEALTTPMVPTPRRRRGRLALWTVILCGVLALLVFGRSATFQHWLPGQNQPPTTSIRHQQTTTPTAKKTAAPSATALSNASPTLPRPSVPVGELLYGTLLPDCDPQQSSLWSPNSNAQVACTSSAMTLTNTTGRHIAGVFLKGLPGGAPVPDNYVLEVHVHVSPSSQGAFGIFFRTQSGEKHQGAFSFLINPSGNWTGNIYDNDTGKPSKLYGRQSPPLDAHGFTTIDIVVEGGSFSLYFNGVEQGGIGSGNYPSGNLGLVAERGTEVQFKDMAIYTLPNG
jgi:serine/threonine protein kinase